MPTDLVPHRAGPVRAPTSWYRYGMNRCRFKRPFSGRERAIFWHRLALYQDRRARAETVTPMMYAVVHVPISETGNEPVMIDTQQCRLILLALFVAGTAALPAMAADE